MLKTNGYSPGPNPGPWVGRHFDASWEQAHRLKEKPIRRKKDDATLWLTGANIRHGGKDGQGRAADTKVGCPRYWLLAPRDLADSVNDGQNIDLVRLGVINDSIRPFDDLTDLRHFKFRQHAA